MKKFVNVLAVVLVAVMSAMVSGCATSGPHDYMGATTQVFKGLEPKDGQLVSLLSVVEVPKVEEHMYVITWQYLWSNPDTKPQGVQILIIKGALYCGLTSEVFVPGTYLVEPIFGDVAKSNTKRFTPMVIKTK